MVRRLALADLLERNRAVDNVENPSLAGFIAFGDDGTGSPFCVSNDGGDAVYYWSAIDQRAMLVADDLPGFWTAWVSDALPPH